MVMDEQATPINDNNCDGKQRRQGAAWQLKMAAELVANGSAHMRKRASDTSVDEELLRTPLMPLATNHNDDLRASINSAFLEAMPSCSINPFDDCNLRPFNQGVNDIVSRDNGLVRLNVGGKAYLLRARTIQKHGPDTLLTQILGRGEREHAYWAHAYIKEKKELFFERPSRLFDSIYDFYCTGELHIPQELCLKRFLQELSFWRISTDYVSDCCNPFKEEEEIEEELEAIHAKNGDLFAGKRCGELRNKIWKVTEGLEPSKWWKAYEIASTAFVLISIAALVVSSLQSMQVTSIQLVNRTINETQPDGTYELKLVTDTVTETHEHPMFAYIEYVCVVYFILEYSTRLLVSPEKKAFALVPLNIVDLMAILPFILEIVLGIFNLGGEQVRQVRWAMLTVRVLRVLRVVRIAKLSRFSPGLRNFALTLNRSKKQLQMVAIILVTGVIFFSTLVYFLEKDEEFTQFTSIPASFWWCIVTMTTVGYGDVVPTSSLGKIIASGAIMAGVMVLALPITIIVNNFMHVSRMNQASIHTLGLSGQGLLKAQQDNREKATSKTCSIKSETKINSIV